MRIEAWRSDEGPGHYGSHSPDAHNPACVTLGKWLPLSVPPFPHLENGVAPHISKCPGSPTLALGAGGVLPSSMCIS